MYNPCAKQEEEFLLACKPFLPLVPFDGPLEVTAVFYYSRPKNHYRSGKFSNMLKEGQRYWHINRSGNIFIV
jgi:hypothetical protein